MVDESGNRQGIAVHLVDGIEDGLDHLNGLLAPGVDLLAGLVLCSLPCLGNIDLDECGSACVNGLVVHVDNVLTLLEVGCRGLFLHVADSVFLRNDLCQSEECRLQNGVGALAHADLACEVDGVYHVKLDVVVCNVALGSSVKMMLKLSKIPLAVYEEHAAGLNVADDGEALGYVCRNMACNEVGLVDVVRALDLLVAESQVADGDAAGLLGVVLEVSLNVLVGVVADDLDGVLVSADGAVAAETPELALDGALCSGGGSSDLGQGEVSYVINDADSELTLHLILLELIVNSKDGCGRSILRTEAVAAADDLNVTAGVGNGGDNVEVQRFALSAGLLGAVKNSDLLAGRGNSLEELIRSPGTEQSYLDKADLLTLSGEVVDNFLSNVTDGAHGNDDAICVGSAVIVKQLVVGAELFVNLAHVLLDDLGDSVVVFVGGLTVLEEDISVFVGAAHGGVLRIESSLAEGADGVHVAHVLEVLIVPDSDLLDLVRGAEAVKEVEEGYAALDSCKVSNGSEIHDLLNVALAEHGKAGLAAGHDVGVVAEDAEGMGSQSAGGDMEDAGEQLACDLVHVGDHQQKTLRSSVGGGECAGVQGAVHCAGRAGLCLHLLHLDGAAEDVFLSLCRPLVNKVCHRARRRDRVDGRNLGERIAYMRRRLVAVHRLVPSCHIFSSQYGNNDG